MSPAFSFDIEVTPCLAKPPLKFKLRFTVAAHSLHTAETFSKLERFRLPSVNNFSSLLESLSDTGCLRMNQSHHWAGFFVNSVTIDQHIKCKHIIYVCVWGMFLWVCILNKISAFLLWYCFQYHVIIDRNILRVYNMYMGENIISIMSIGILAPNDAKWDHLQMKRWLQI